MSFDPLIANPGRLSILTALAIEPSQEFVRLRSSTRMTDGNLSTHARRLHTAGLVAIDKRFTAGRPVTTITLTPAGREALQTHTQRLLAALQPPARDIPITPAAPPDDLPEYLADDWVD